MVREVCVAKQLTVENQITYASKHNNTYQSAGLQKSRREIEEQLNAPQLQKQHQLKLLKKEKSG